jgi:hypothetical protein
MAEILPLRKAISDLLHDGDVVAMEGFRSSNRAARLSSASISSREWGISMEDTPASAWVCRATGLSL